MPGLLPDVRFAAFLQYSPRGTSDASKESRKWRDAVKFMHPQPIATAMDLLARDLGKTQLDEILTTDAVIVPAPRSAPNVEGGLWPADLLGREIAKRKLVGGVAPLLRRTRAVPKAAFASPSERPTAQTHFDTIALTDSATMFSPAGRIVVLDDVVTRGAMLLACVSRIAVAYPGTEVVGFAMLRTVSTGDVPHVIAPVLGDIRLVNGQTYRTP
jgi:predicted amidophosphoribosyltransferase